MVQPDNGTDAITSLPLTLAPGSSDNDEMLYRGSRVVSTAAGAEPEGAMQAALA